MAIWANTSSGIVETWNDVVAEPEYPETNMVLVAPEAGTSYSDMLLTPLEGPVIPIRLDVAENNADPLYRAAAIANAEGSLTFMSWQEYQRVLNNNQTGIQLVSVKASDGDVCINPSIESITSGQYPYAVDSMLIVSQSRFASIEVQSFLWYLFSDGNFETFQQTGLVGPSFGELPTIRDELQTLFAEAQVDTLASQTSEATPEVFGEATPEVIPDTNN
jgi:hypothetical protein